MSVSRELLYEVLEYPIVTYITLLSRNLIATEKKQLPFSHENIELIQDQKSLTNKLSLLGIDMEFNNDFSENLYLLATNLEILDLKYRTIKITSFARKKTNFIYLLSIRKSYFYNNRIYINAFDLQGKLIPIPTRIYQIN